MSIAPARAVPRPLRQLLKYGAVLIAYGLIAVLQTYPTIRHLGELTPLRFNSIGGLYCLAEGSLMFYEHPWSLHQAFSPSVMVPMPSPLFTAGTTVAAHLIFGPPYLITRNLYLAGNLFMLICLTTSAFSMFFLARYWLENSRAAFLAGMVFSLSSTNLFLTVDVGYMCLPLVPLILLAFEKYAREGRVKHLLVCALLVVVQFYTLFYHLIATLYFLLVFSLLQRRQVWRKKNWAALAGCSALAVVLALPLALPYLQTMLQFGINATNPVAWLSWTSIAPAEWFNVPANNLFYGRWLAQTYESRDWTLLLALFPGVIIVLLVVTGAWSKRAAKISPRFLRGVMLFVLVIVTGIYPLHFFKTGPSVPLFMALLTRIMPLFAFFRVPYRLLFLFNLAGGVLAGGGYLRLEQGVSNWGFRRLAPFVFLPLVLLINLENLSIPLKLENYDMVFGPSNGDRWLKNEDLPPHPNDLIMHIPAFYYTPQADQPLIKIYEGSYSDCFRHLYNRHPMVNGFFSYMPKGFIPYPATLLPQPIAQKYLRALGVKIVVVHKQLLYGYHQQKFSESNMIQCGFKLLKSFPDGDAVYLMDPQFLREDNLYVVPNLSGDRLEISMVTPEYYQQAVKPNKYFDINDSRSFWVNPMTCMIQRLQATVEDGEGRMHTRKFSYNLPLVVGGLKVDVVKWDLDAEGWKGPYRIISIRLPESYLLQPPDLMNQWKLESN